MELKNYRYKHFQQDFYTAGDYEQFISFLNQHRKEMKSCNDDIIDDLPKDIHKKIDWEFYKTGPDIMSSFEYIFYKFKKGIYVQIVNNQLNIFLPFSNVYFENEYHGSLSINTQKFSSFEEMYSEICKIENRPFNKDKINRHPNLWYCNNGLVRYEYPIHENDTGFHHIHSMLCMLCQEKKIPDCEFFINKRDFPILRRDLCEPYTAIFGEGVPLKSFKQSNYLPILSMCSHPDYVDIPIPTWEDWARCKFLHDKTTFKKTHREYNDDFSIEWSQKIPTLIFRGASTGLGTTIQTNPRLYFSKLSLEKKCDPADNVLFMDVGITKWNMRPRKSSPGEYLDIPEIGDLPLLGSMDAISQSRYKYILHLPGHSCAYRLSLELAMGSVIFIYPSEYSLWYMHLLEPYVHYIPLEKELGPDDIYNKILWCKKHDDEAKKIAENARKFYDRYLNMDNTLDYLQKILISISRKFGYDCQKYYNLFNLLHLEKIKYISSSSALSEIYDHSDEWIKIRSSKNTVIHKFGNYIIKEKKMDMTHEYFISRVFCDKIKSLCPNFGEVFDYKDNYLVMPDYSPLFTLDAYIRSPKFNMMDFRSILAQIALSLDIAQKIMGFMHYDLCPWNILLLPNKSKIVYHYHDGDYSLSCPYLVKIIDFEYANIIWNDCMIHNTCSFFISSVHDFRCTIFHSIYLILSNIRLSKKDISWIFEIINIFVDRPFGGIADLKSFLYFHKKFSIQNRFISSSSEKKNMNDIISFLLTELKYIHIIPTINNWYIHSSYEFSDFQTQYKFFSDQLGSSDNLIDLYYQFSRWIDYCHANSLWDPLSEDMISDIQSIMKKYKEGSYRIIMPIIYKLDIQCHPWYYFSDTSHLPRIDFSSLLFPIYKYLYLAKYDFVRDTTSLSVFLKSFSL